MLASITVRYFAAAAAAAGLQEETVDLPAGASFDDLTRLLASRGRNSNAYWRVVPFSMTAWPSGTAPNGPHPALSWMFSRRSLADRSPLAHPFPKEALRHL